MAILFKKITHTHIYICYTKYKLHYGVLMVGEKIKNVSEQSRNGPDLGIEMYLLGHVYLGFIFTCGGTQ